MLGFKVFIYLSRYLSNVVTGLPLTLSG